MQTEQPDRASNAGTFTRSIAALFALAVIVSSCMVCSYAAGCSAGRGANHPGSLRASSTPAGQAIATAIRPPTASIQ